jgi:hypothetical protein
VVPSCYQRSWSDINFLHIKVTPASELVGTKCPSLQLQQPASWSIHRGLCLTLYTGPCSVPTEGWVVHIFQRLVLNIVLTVA